jgi:exopolysaccharide/PEP-CTERM locus tyrosine autokinase
MTEQSKIPLPPEGGEGKDSSLFERASGAFGLDPFRVAPVPGKLAEPAMKRARPVMREEAPPTAPVPATVAPAPIVVEPAVRAVRFDGARHPVDRERLRSRGMIVPEAPVSALLEEFRIVKRQLISAAREAGTAAARRVLVCSPLPGEGKTFCATNLAIAMAGERDSEVLLVDADFAKPSILSTLGLPKGPGMMDALADPSIEVESLVMGTDIPGLWVLPAGSQTNADSEFLASERTADLLDRLTEGAPDRMLVFDTPPALAASPAAELAKHVGQAVLIARADRTGQSALEDACRLLGACPDIKLLLNAAQFSPSGRRFGTYYGYEG